MIGQFRAHCTYHLVDQLEAPGQVTLRWVEVGLVGSHSDRGGGVVGRQVQLALCGHRDQALRVHLEEVISCP